MLVSLLIGLEVLASDDDETPDFRSLEISEGGFGKAKRSEEAWNGLTLVGWWLLVVSMLGR